jgi:hypothetical protein
MVCTIRSSFILVFLFISNITGLLLLKEFRYFSKTIPVRDFNSLNYYFSEKTPQEFKQFSGDTPENIMKNVMNFVSVKRPGRQKSDKIKDIYIQAQTGGGLTCAGMAELFLHALRLQGYKARKLFVVKSIGDSYATHTIVEVFRNGKWIIYDPTFNVSFKRGDQLLGATDIAQSLLDGSCQYIEPVFYGEVAYKARLETYPIYWLAHFNNVLMFKHANYSSSWIIRNTIQLITRYWYGPVLYYFSPTGRSNDYLELINWFYFFFTCIGPVMLLILTAIYVIIPFWRVNKTIRK